MCNHMYLKAQILKLYFIETMDLYKTPYFHVKLLSSNFSLCTKIEILKHVPEGDETEQGLQRELRVLRYIICLYDYFSKSVFNTTRFAVSRVKIFHPCCLIGLSAFFHPSNASHSVYNRWYKKDKPDPNIGVACNLNFLNSIEYIKP